jgi:hypothetical protein
MDEGLIVYPASGTVDGRSGDHVLVAPPFIIEESEIDDLVGAARPRPFGIACLTGPRPDGSHGNSR